MATQFKNIVVKLKQGERLQFDYTKKLKEIRQYLESDGPLDKLAPVAAPKLLDDALLRDTEEALSAYKQWRDTHLKTGNKAPITTHLKNKSKLNSNQKALLQKFLTGKATLTEKSLKQIGIHAKTGTGNQLLKLIGDGYQFPNYVAPSSDVTAENMQKLLTNREWLEFFKARADADTNDEVMKKFKSEVAALEYKGSTVDPELPDSPEPTESTDKTTPQATESTDKTTPQATESTDETTPQADSMLRGTKPKPIDLSRDEELKRGAMKALESDAPVSEGSSSTDVPPVSEGEQRLAQQGLTGNPIAAKAAELAEAKEVLAAEESAKTFFLKKQNINKQTGKGTLEQQIAESTTKSAIEDSIAKLVENESASQAERNEAAKIIQNLATKRARLRAATAFREQMVEDRRAEPFRGFQPGNLNPSTAIPQREAVTPDAEPVLDESNVAKRIEGSGDVGTESAPVENLVMENVSRGHEADGVPSVGNIMKDVGSTSKDDEKEVAGLNIGEAKDRIRALHKVFDNLIPEFKSASHKKNRDKALKSSDEKAVKKHLLNMFKKIRAFYSGGPSGLRVGIVIPAEAIIQSLLGGSAPAAQQPAPVSAPSQTTFGLGGSQRAPEHPGSVLHKKGSDPYGTAMSIAIHRRNSGMSSFLRKGVANHEVTNTVPVISGKVHKPIIKMNQNTPMPGHIGQIMGRTTKSLGIKIKM